MTLIAAAVLLAFGARADGTGDEVNAALPQVDVIARAPAKFPTPVDVIDSEKIADKAVTDALDIFRLTPGAITVNFGQGDIGNPIGLRGFVSDHGQDVAIFIDGVPINVANHAHAHGLADIGWLIPELIERVEVIKGPFSAQYGNFALGGVINIITKNADEHSSVQAQGGSFGEGRALGIYSTPIGKITPFLAFEYDHKDGYRDANDYNRYNLFNKFSLPLAGGTLSARVQAVARDFGAPGYLPLIEVQNGDLGRTQAINSTDGGNSQLYDLVVNYVPGVAGGPRLSFYGGHDQLNRYADFVRDDQTPAQRQDHSERNFYGWRGSYDFRFRDFASLTIGTDGQFDDGSYQRHPTINRAPTGTTRDRDVDQLGTSVWAQADVHPWRYVVLTGGVRYDRFDIDIDNRITPGNSGNATPDVVSPKIGAVISPFSWVDLYANTGRGFRSPAASELSPDGGAGTAFGLDPPTLRSTDTGIKLRPLPRLTVTFDYYFTKTKGEISQVVDPVTGEVDFINIGRTKRDGYEASVNYDVSSDLNLFASFSAVNARLSGAPSGADYIANVPFDSQTFGVTWRSFPRPDLKLVLDGYIQRLGEQPLANDRSTIGPAVTRIAGKASLLSRGPWSGFVQLVYLPDRFASESVFDFGDPRPPATTDIRYAPNPTISVLAGLKYSFHSRNSQ